MKLLAIGGPRHGEELPYREGQQSLVVPLIPELLVARTFRPLQYCVHGATIRSKNDGDKHFVSARQVADLYGLHPVEWKLAQGIGMNRWGDPTHPTDAYCLFPDYWGRYDRSALPPLDSVDSLVIRAGEYRTRAIADRLCWVYVG